MIVCPGCGQEVHAMQPNIEVTLHGNPLELGGSRSIAGRLMGKGRMNFHNEQCLKKWLDQKVPIPAK